MTGNTEGGCCFGHHVRYIIVVVAMVIGVDCGTDYMRSYEGSQVLRIDTPKQQTEWNRLNEDLKSLDVDVWKYATGGDWADILVSRDYISRTRHVLNSHGLQYHVTHTNIQRNISDERNINHQRYKRAINPETVVRTYARYQEILAWMEYLARRHPAVASVIDLGKTFEGRRMKVLKLVEGYRENRTSTVSLLKSLDWYLMPVVNPDGYEYSHVKDRLWRKNRQTFNNSSCHGIDLNRNWAYKWGGVSSSTNPCDGLFRGNSPEEALEVKNIVGFLIPRSEAFMGFITYHSYGQSFISRWDYSKYVIPADHRQLISVARKAVRKMQKVNGVSYKAGRAPEILYPYGGGSPDWAKAVARIKYSYLIELRDEHTFILPPDQIIATGDENWAAIRLIGREIISKYGRSMAPHVDDPPSDYVNPGTVFHVENKKNVSYTENRPDPTNAGRSSYETWSCFILLLVLLNLL